MIMLLASSRSTHIFRLIIKNDENLMIGGLCCYSVLGTMTVNDLWVDGRCRGQGYGKELMMHAEKVTRERRCETCSTI